MKKLGKLSAEEREKLIALKLEDVDSKAESILYAIVMVQQCLFEGKSTEWIKKYLQTTQLALTDDEVGHSLAMGELVFDLANGIKVEPSTRMLIDSIGEGVLALLVYYLKLEENAAQSQ